MLRKIVSLGLLWSALVMTLTGLALFIAPHGRVERWIDWRLAGLSKTEFQMLHSTFMALFIFLTLLHIYYNWHAIALYLKNQAKVLVVATREMAIATIVTALFIAGTLQGWPPFTQLIALGDTAKDYWSIKGEPPFGQAENATLTQLARRTGLDAQEAQERLAAAGLVYEPQWNLAQIAAANQVSPQTVYRIVSGR